MSSTAVKKTPPKPTSGAAPSPRAKYEKPCMSKRRSVARVTLFSAGGTSSTGFTTSG